MLPAWHNNQNVQNRSLKTEGCYALGDKTPSESVEKPLAVCGFFPHYEIHTVQRGALGRKHY